ncbi:TPA: transcription-repair coupling factor, partial [Streptococcus pyogenes]|nr:transcription-repair coupling factor [Streptococcus pyogenes]HER4137779.1 transcription-repair coupling factor [Streptococcus pyogenes]HER4177070.1 transcription-repair coupling factor [Streptococcus pyogenes]HER4468136.1 transcription-repair coupling factor [Streptococcus pyogenes]
MDILELFSQNKKVQSWHSGLTTLGRQLVMGLSGSSKTLAIASAYLDDQKKIVVVTSTQNEVEKLASDLSSLLDEELVFQFFADDVAAAEFIFASMDKALSRIETLQFLRNPKSQGVLIVSLSGLRILLPNPDVFTKSQIQLTVGEDYDSDTLTKQLMTIGYQKVSQVISPGEFSRRGDILDIYEITQELPYRLEFFGDDIDSIRQFHPETQKSFEQLEGIFINPASDLIFEVSDFQRGIEQLEKALQTAQDDKKSYLEDVLAVSKNGFKHKDIRKFQSLFYE